MFGFLKNKLKSAVSIFTKKVEKEIEKPVEEKKPKEELKKEKVPKQKKEKAQKKIEEQTEEKEEVVTEKKEKKFGFFSALKEKITTQKLSDDKFSELFEELELALLEANVAVEVIEKLKEDLKKCIVNTQIKRSEIDKIIGYTLKTSIDSILSAQPVNLINEIKNKSPYVICFIGVNGSGKSTTIYKIAHLLQKNNISCVIAAADTFRAAAIEQLAELAKKLGTKMISHEYGADPAAVAFDAISYAKAHHINAVLIDTAGRLHSNKDLMAEMQKIVRVAKPDIKLFVGESITGNDCISQAVEFNESVGIDGIILSKVDVDEKGGAAVSISYVTGKPILYMGTGQGPDDLEPFSKDKIIKSLGL